MVYIPKRHVYKITTSTGVYLGTLKGITSDFKYIQDVNTIGPSSINISVGKSGYVAQEAVKAITTEDDKWIMTEDGLYGLVTEGSAEVLGVGTMVRNGNRITITEYSTYYPNGFVVFTGKLVKWNANFGTDDDITLTAINTATDLMNILVKGPPILVTEITVSTSSYLVYENNAGAVARVGQMLYANYAGTPLNINALTLTLSAQSASFPATFTVELWSVSSYSSTYGINLYGTAPLATASLVVTSTTKADYQFEWDAVPIIPYGNYGMIVKASAASNNGGYVWYEAVSVSGGLMMYANNAGSHYDFYSATAALRIGIYYDGGVTQATFTNTEPTLMITQAIDRYRLRGGVVTYSGASITASANIVPTYTFNTNTLKELLDVAMDFLPSNYYYYVDGNNVLYVKPISATADYRLTLGKDIQNLDVTADITNVVNDVYFTGGKVSTTNLYIYNTDTVSKANYGAGLYRFNDTRVTDASTANTQSYNYIQRNKDEQFHTTVKIPDNTRDISLLMIGKTVSFQNVPKIIATLVLAIVRVEREHGQVLLTIGTLPPRTTDRMAKSEQDLLALQTVANPTAPS